MQVSVEYCVWVSTAARAFCSLLTSRASMMLLGLLPLDCSWKKSM
jgi:hypothetical protein